jgi:hypothetical protein
MRAIEACRTAVLGGHVDFCLDCGTKTPSYNSCRNRHCPKCQGLEQAEWIEARKARTLPTHHFHVVFTIPAQLRSLAKANQEVVYSERQAIEQRAVLAAVVGAPEHVEVAAHGREQLGRGREVAVPLFDQRAASKAGLGLAGRGGVCGRVVAGLASTLPR